MARYLTRKFLGLIRRRQAGTENKKLRVDASGIHIDFDGKESVMLEWNDIQRIMAFKRDVYAHDLVCMLIEKAGAGSLEVNESMHGWTELVNQLPVRLPAAMRFADWFPQVTSTVFEPSPVEVFARTPRR